MTAFVCRRPCAQGSIKTFWEDLLEVLEQLLQAKPLFYGDAGICCVFWSICEKK